jgi:biopolymer transport protein ExbB/TolQ
MPTFRLFRRVLVRALPLLLAACASQEPAPDAQAPGPALRTTPHKTTEAIMSARLVAISSFKNRLWALGTVGSSAPFVGLFGTVVGILKAFQSMSVAGTGGFKVVSQGIAAALVATAAGLLVAIYAVIAYNYFVARVNALALSYKLYCEEFLTALGEYARVRGTALPAATAAASAAPAAAPATSST